MFSIGKFETSYHDEFWKELERCCSMTFIVGEYVFSNFQLSESCGVHNISGALLKTVSNPKNTCWSLFELFREFIQKHYRVKLNSRVGRKRKHEIRLLNRYFKPDFPKIFLIYVLNKFKKRTSIFMSFNVFILLEIENFGNWKTPIKSEMWTEQKSMGSILRARFKSALFSWSWILHLFNLLNQTCVSTCYDDVLVDT